MAHTSTMKLEKISEIISNEMMIGNIEISLERNIIIVLNKPNPINKLINGNKLRWSGLHKGLLKAMNGCPDDTWGMRDIFNMIAKIPLLKGFPGSLVLRFYKTDQF